MATLHAPCWVGIIQQLVVSLSPWYKEIDFNNKYYFNVYFSTNKIRERDHILCPSAAGSGLVQGL